MAIDRNAIAYIGDNNGGLFTVDTAHVTSSCKKTSFKSPNGKYGMGFSTDVAGGTTDTLYIDYNESMPGAGDSAGLAKVDLAAMTATAIGMFSGAQSGHDCELTGTGDAKLYGFFFQQTSTVNAINKSSAAILSNANVPVNINPNPLGGGSYAWAFSFWGGDFYLYTYDSSVNQSSQVTRYRPSDGSSTTVLSDIGFNIVGAGVSTCAPTMIPPVK
jgi:hypothetical protein